MTFKENLIENKNKLHDFLINPKVVKICIIIALIVFVPSIIIGLIVAQLDTSGIWTFWIENPSLWAQYGMGGSDNAGYSIFTDYISNLGSLNYTPIPKFLDDAVMITAITMVPVIFYLKKVLDSTIQERAESKKKIGKILSNLALITYLIGLIGFFGVGFFSEDVADFLEIATNGLATVAGYDFHDFFTVLVFGFLALSGVFIGLIFIIYSSLSFELFKVKIPKSLIIIAALEMIFLPITLSMVFLTYWWPFIEWMAMISLFGWIIPLALLTVKRINSELDSERKKIGVKKIHDFLINPKVVRVCVTALLIIFVPMIIVGLIIAQLDPSGPTIVLPTLSYKDLAGYNIYVDYISNLGSYRFTPIPKFLDDTAMLCSMLFIPVAFYIKHLTNSTLQEPRAKVRKILSNGALISMLLAMVGMFSVGFFNEDVGDSLQALGVEFMGLDLHNIASLIIFGFLSLTGIFIGLLVILHTQIVLDMFVSKLPKSAILPLGVWMVIFPPVFCVLMIIGAPPSRPLWEWILMFSFFAWIIPLAFMTLKRVKLDVKIR